VPGEDRGRARTADSLSRRSRTAVRGWLLNCYLNFLKLHAACAGLSEFFEATASLAGYFPKPTAVDPKWP
jgi:hypothetical protein